MHGNYSVSAKERDPLFPQSLEAVGSMREGKIPGSDFEIFGERDMIVGRPLTPPLPCQR